MVVNHHLFFADLALRDTGVCLRVADYDAVIFDEARQIEDTATLFFGSRLLTAMLDKLVRDARAALRSERGEKKRRRACSMRCSDRSSRFFSALPRSANGGRSVAPGGDSGRRLFALDNTLAELAASCRNLRPPRENALPKWRRRADQLRDARALSKRRAR